MEDLVIMKNRQAVTSSLMIAEIFSKEHRHVLEAIDVLKDGVAENWADLFYEDAYTHPQNKQQYRVIYMNRDGFTLLAMGFTGSKAMQFKLKYIKAFNEMEDQLKKEKIDTTQLSPDLQMFKKMFDSVANQELRTKKLGKKVDNIAEIVSLNAIEWRKTAQSLIHKMAKTEGGFGAYQQIQSDLYTETDKRAGSDLNRRLKNIRKNMALEGASKSRIQKMNKLDVLENDKRLKEVYMAIVKDFAIKYKVWEEEY